MKTVLSLVLACFLIGACSCKEKNGTNMTANVEPQSELYSFAVHDIDGNEISLSVFKGKVLLIVNVASKCGYTKQYAGLEDLYKKYKDRGFVILGFPANNFGGQEPGTNAEIKAFCSAKYNVSFPIFEKISVKGDDISPLYAYLTDKNRNPGGDKIGWNFSKILIGRDGKTINTFQSSVEPLSPELTEQIEIAIR